MAENNITTNVQALFLNKRSTSMISQMDRILSAAKNMTDTIINTATSFLNISMTYYLVVSFIQTNSEIGLSFKK